MIIFDITMKGFNQPIGSYNIGAVLRITLLVVLPWFCCAFLMSSCTLNSNWSSSESYEMPSNLYVCSALSLMVLLVSAATPSFLNLSLTLLLFVFHFLRSILASFMMVVLSSYIFTASSSVSTPDNISSMYVAAISSLTNSGYAASYFSK